MTREEFIASLPADGTWETEGSDSKVVARDITGKHPPQIFEKGDLSSRTRGRLTPKRNG